MIVLIAAAAIASRRAVLTYTDNVVPIRYSFGKFECYGVGQAEGEARVIDALNEIHAKAPGVIFKAGDGGIVFEATACDRCYVSSYSSIPNNIVQLGRCVTDKAAIIHEVLHKMGFMHEQFHKDAAAFVTVNESLLPPDWRDQWVTNHPILAHSEFDICSVMMYDAESEFWPNNAVVYTERGQAERAKCGTNILSEGDIAALNHVYPHTHHPESGQSFVTLIVLFMLLAGSVFIVWAAWW